eukprot:1345481-Amphidinium_carterae.1
MPKDANNNGGKIASEHQGVRQKGNNECRWHELFSDYVTATNALTIISQSCNNYSRQTHRNDFWQWFFQMIAAPCSFKFA